MLSYQSIADQELQNSKMIEMHFKDSIDLLNDAYNLFLQSILESQNKLGNKIDSNFHKVFLSMCMKINSDARTIMVATRYGWYGTAHTLFREINDALITVALIWKSPDYANRIINGNFHNDEIKQKAKDLGLNSIPDRMAYGRLSNAKHAEGEEILAWYGNNSGANIQRFNPTLDEDHVETILLFACGILIHTANYYKEFHMGRYGRDFIKIDFPDEVNSTASKIINLLNNAIKKMDE
jgi:hypothetical protein